MNRLFLEIEVFLLEKRMEHLTRERDRQEGEQWYYIDYCIECLHIMRLQALILISDPAASANYETELHHWLGEDAA